MSEVKQIPLSKLEVNNGQIAGLPKNPRFIKDYKFQKLKKSLEDSPEIKFIGNGLAEFNIFKINILKRLYTCIYMYIGVNIFL